MHGSVASLLLVRVRVAVSRDRRDEGAAESVPCSRGLPEGFLPVMLLLAGADEEDDAPVLSMWK